MNAVYRPIWAGKPAIVAYASAFGSTTAAAVSPARMSRGRAVRSYLRNQPRNCGGGCAGVPMTAGTLGPRSLTGSSRLILLRHVLVPIGGFDVPVRLLAIGQLRSLRLFDHVLVGHLREQVLDHVEARAALVVGADHVPRRKIGIGGGEHRVPGPGVVVPSRVGVEVHGGELPDFSPILDALLQSLRLFLLAHL